MNDNFAEGLAESLAALNELVDKHGLFDPGAPSIFSFEMGELENVLSVMLQIDTLHRAEMTGITLPMPDDIVELMGKSFLWGFMYARRELTKNDN